VINADPPHRRQTQGRFLPNYRVSLAQRIVPQRSFRANLHRRKEASGTGNMKLALNGALTIGTLDGANVRSSRRSEKRTSSSSA